MKYLSTTSLIIGISISSSVGFAQTATDLNEGSTVTPSLTPDNYIFSWWGKLNRFYIIEHSTDLLSPWSHIPAIEPGYDEVAEWGFATNADKFFLRLKYTDDALTGSFYGDDDADGIINGVEMLLGYSAITANGNTDGDLLSDRAEIALGLDPEDNTDAVDGDGDGIVDAIEKIYGLSTSGTTDLDGDSMHDEWELLYHLNLEIDDSALDPDQDGLTHLEEFQEGTNPWAFDTDGDTIPDGLEVANIPDLDPLTAEPIHIRNNYAWKFTTNLTNRFSEFSDRISESSTHSIGLDKDGKVYTWGTNEYGQLGMGSGTANTGDIANPTQSQFADARSVSAGDGTSHIVTLTGTAQAAGENAGGLLGIGNTPFTPSAPVDIPSTVAGLAGKEIFRISGKYLEPSQFSEHREAIVGSSKEIYAWGILAASNYNGPNFTGTPEGAKKNLSDLVSISSGETSGSIGATVALNSSGDVFSWGRNLGYLQLGNTNSNFVTNKSDKYQIATLSPASYANAKLGYGATLGFDGQVSAWGLFRGTNGIAGLSGFYYQIANNQQGTPTIVPSTSDSRAVAIPLMTEADHSLPLEKAGFYLDSGGALWTFYWQTDSLQGDANNATQYGSIRQLQIGFKDPFVAMTEAHEGVYLMTGIGELYKYTPTNGSYTFPYYNSGGQLVSFETYSKPSGDGAFTKVDIPNFYDLVDTNSDGISDLYARFAGLNPDATDSNLDDVSDVVALTNGASPTAWDNDGDTIPNAVEVARGLNPNSKDTDGDGMLDNEELYIIDRYSNYILQTDANSQGPEINLVAPTNATAL